MEAGRPSPPRAEAWTRAVRGYFGRRCARAEDAEDLAQEALCAIIQGAPRFRGECSEATWVYAVCHNVLSAWLRSKAREEKAVEAAEESRAARDEERACLALDLEKALAGLRPSEQRLYRLYYVEGKSVAEIAFRLGRPVGTVKYLLHGLREGLRKLLGAS